MTNNSLNLSMQIRRWLYIFLVTAIALIMLAWAVRGVSLKLLVEAWRQAQIGWLGCALIVFLASYVVRAKRWGTLLGKKHYPSSFGTRLGAIFIGFGCNCILPGRVGELIRALVLHRQSKVPLGKAVGSIFTARLLDALIAFILLLGSIAAIARSGSTIMINLPLELITFVLVFFCTAFLLAAWYPKVILRIVGRICPKIGLGRWSDSIVATIGSILTGLDVFKYPRRCLSAIVETFCIWGMMGATFWFCAIAFGIISPGYIGSLFLQSVVALAIVVPSSPGYLGTFEAGIRFGLELYQIAPGVIVAYALTLHLLMNASLTIIGGAIAMKQGLSWQDFMAVKSGISKSLSSPIDSK